MTPASLSSLSLLFLRLGLTAFGGPAAHIAMMRQEIVDRRQWLTSEEFLDLLGASNLIPGPSSTELAIHIGFRLARWRGLILAGVCFILPAFLLVAAIASIYVRFGRLPQAAAILYGVKPVVVAVVLQALYALGRTALKTNFLIAAGVLASAAAFLTVTPLAILLAAAILTAAQSWIAADRRPPRTSLAPVLWLAAFIAASIAALIAAPLLLAPFLPASPRVELASLLLLFIKFGSIVYGSGYVLLAFLRADLVTRLHWLTSAQLLDAIAVGQVTPGPVFTTATFIGFVLAGPAGACLATLGIFLPHLCSWPPAVR